MAKEVHYEHYLNSLTIRMQKKTSALRTKNLVWDSERASLSVSNFDAANLGPCVKIFRENLTKNKKKTKFEEIYPS